MNGPSTSSRAGVVLMSGSSIVFCLMSVLVRRASDIDSFMVAQFRFLIGLALLGTAALSGRIRLEFRNSRLLFLRGLTGGVAVFLFYVSIARLGLGKGTVISYCYPVFATLFGAFYLRERLTFVRGAAVAAALGGIVLLAVGGNGGPGTGWGGLGHYELLAILGAALSGAAVTIVRKLHQTDTTYAIFCAQCVVGLWLVIIPANVSGDSLGYGGGAMLLVIGVLAAGGQLLMTEGYRHVSVTTGSLLGMLVPVLNLAVGTLFFGERMSGRGLLGSAVVLAACGAVILTEREAEEEGRRTGPPRHDPQ
ncbi:MAG: DMT family transporter [Lentisphaeria bacterium]|nr:DMT family transporter [Lentisphaeria bacterium]